MRLTDSIRDQILSSITDKYFKDKEDTINCISEGIGDATLDEVFGTVDWRNLPDVLVKPDRYLIVFIDNKDRTQYLSLRCTDNIPSIRSIELPRLSESLQKEIIAYKTKLESYRSLRKVAINNFRNILQNCRTLKQLQDCCPELAQFAPVNKQEQCGCKETIDNLKDQLSKI